jgi:hypothetical protein
MLFKPVWKQQLMIGAGKRPQPRFVQSGQLRRQSHQRVHELDLVELFGTVAAGDQQMADFMLRIQ